MELCKTRPFPTKNYGLNGPASYIGGFLSRLLFVSVAASGSAVRRIFGQHDPCMSLHVLRKIPYRCPTDRSLSCSPGILLSHFHFHTQIHTTLPSYWVWISLSTLWYLPSSTAFCFLAGLAGLTVAAAALPDTPKGAKTGRRAEGVGGPDGETVHSGCRWTQRTPR